MRYPDKLQSRLHERQPSPSIPRELEASTAAALNKLSQTEAKMGTLQSALESTQTELFELKNKFDEEAGARYSDDTV